MINHWEQMQSVFGRTAPFEAARGAIEQVKDAWKILTGEIKSGSNQVSEVSSMLASLFQYHYLAPYISQWKNATKAAEEHAKQLERVKEANEKIAGIKGDRASERGSDFQKALEMSGGGPAVIRQMTDEAVRKGGITDPKMREAMADNIRLTVNKGLEGELVDKALPEAAQPAR